MPPLDLEPCLVFERALVSWYGPGFHGRLTANGETFDQNAMTAAHKTLPFNTYVRVSNQSSGRSVIVRINDRGPFIEPREFDLSAHAGALLGLDKTGVGMMTIERLNF